MPAPLRGGLNAQPMRPTFLVPAPEASPPLPRRASQALGRAVSAACRRAARLGALLAPWLALGLLPGCQPSGAALPPRYRQGDPLAPRDRMALEYALRYYARHQWAVSVRTDMYELTAAQVDCRIDRAFYSPDHRRLVLWVSLKEPNARTREIYNREHPAWNRVCPTGGDTVVDVVPLIGLRRADQPWQLYPFDGTSVQCAQSADQARPYLEAYFFDRMKGVDIRVNKRFLEPGYGGADVTAHYNAQLRKMGSEPEPDDPYAHKCYGYNLQDPGFWTKSLLWQQGVLVPGLYLFQTRPGAVPGKDDAPLVPPPVPYPDSIRRLFR